jgi:hypothetical protein
MYIFYHYGFAAHDNRPFFGGKRVDSVDESKVLPFFGGKRVDSVDESSSQFLVFSS